MATLAFELDLPDELRSADNLSSLPVVAHEVLQLTQDENSTIEELAECLSRDPALAARILKVADSSMFSTGQAITSLRRATMVLGLKTVKLMSLSFSLAASVPGKGSEHGFDFLEYWRRSLVRSVSSRALAKLLKSPQSDEAFLCGLLANFGRLALARVLRDDYADLASKCGGWPSADDEQKAFGFTNNDVCATLLKSWEIPELIFMSIGYGTRPDELPDDAPAATRELLEILTLAGLAEGVLCGADKGKYLGRLYKALEDRHGLAESDVDRFLIGLEEGIAETAELLSVALPNDIPHEQILTAARDQIVHVSLGQAAALDEANRDRVRIAHEKEAAIARANTDKLTGLPNRASFDEFLGDHILSRLEGDVPRCLGLVMIDIDHFKSFNDTHGHAVGDEALRAVAQLLADSTRAGDFVARYGGEEFAAVSPQTNPFDLKRMSERLRRALAEGTFKIDGHDLAITASFGAACVSKFESADDATKLIKLADLHLYRAKKKGRNRCEIYRKTEFPGQ